MKPATNIKISPGERVFFTIKRIGINGEGVGFYKKQVIFVKDALPGEEVLVEITKVDKNFAEGKIVKIKKRSEHRVKPPCPIYEKCGGCQLQHLDYGRQLEEKRDLIVQALERHTDLDVENLDIRPTIGADHPWEYRNKSQFQVGVNKGKVIAGLYSLNSHRLIDIPKCIVQHPLINKAAVTVKRILADLEIPIYDERKREGVVRSIVARAGIQTGELQIVLITATDHLPKKERIVAEIRKRLPEVRSIVQNINRKKTSLVFGEESVLLWGKKAIVETLGKFRYELSARAFFQLNPEQTAKLYDEVKKAAGLTGKEKVVDAYCGVGTIGLWLAEEAGEIRGMDTVEEAVADAKKNADLNGIRNVRYEAGKAEQILPKWIKEGWRPDVIIVDPPRSGCDARLLETMLKANAKKIIYVSCNPSTLAKDLHVLTKKYDIAYIQPVDMFPQTSHVECVTKLTLKKIFKGS